MFPIIQLPDYSEEESKCGDVLNWSSFCYIVCLRYLKTPWLYFCTSSNVFPTAPDLIVKFGDWFAYFPYLYFFPSERNLDFLGELSLARMRRCDGDVA